MNTDWQELENVRKRCEALDHELNTFFQSIKEMKEIRDSVSMLPDKLKQSEEELENQKKEIERLMSFTGNLLITFEEQAKGLFFDLEKKTETLAGDVRSGISDLKNVFEMNSMRLSDEQKEKLEQIAKAFDHMKTYYEEMKKALESHEQAINSLKNSHVELLKMFESVEPSLKNIHKTISDLQRRPSDVENKLRAVEEQLRELFFKKLERQKHVILAMLIVLLVSVIFFVFYPK
ncbi:MAG: hypothetical protein HZA14_04815 [Nitrospirae bacterium]|nr:hypothetical protein [Nitrospirota bacterium]